MRLYFSSTFLWLCTFFYTFYCTVLTNCSGSDRKNGPPKILNFFKKQNEKKVILYTDTDIDRFQYIWISMDVKKSIFVSKPSTQIREERKNRDIFLLKICLFLKKWENFFIPRGIVYSGLKSETAVLTDSTADYHAMKMFLRVPLDRMIWEIFSTDA